MELTRVLWRERIDERIDGLFAIERELRSLLDRKLAPLGLTYAQYAMLRFIGDPRGSVAQGADKIVRATDIASYFGFALRTVTVTVNGLAKAGWVRRRKSPTDGRVQELIVTPNGRQVLEQAAEPYRHALRIFQRLPRSHWNALWHTIPSILLEIEAENRLDERRDRGKKG